MLLHLHGLTSSGRRGGVVLIKEHLLMLSLNVISRMLDNPDSVVCMA